MTLATMANNLSRFAPGLNPDIVKSNIQDSYKLLMSKEWNRLNLIRSIPTIIPYKTGTVSIDTSGVVTGVGTTFTSAMAGRFMRVYYDDCLFEVQTYTSPTSVTLRNWTGAVVAAGETYSIFPITYTVDTSFGQIYEVAYQTSLNKKSQSYFNQQDPSRKMTGSAPISWAYAGVNSSGTLLIEIYPVVTSVVSLRIYGKMKYATLGASDTLYLPEDLVEAHALISCYRQLNMLRKDEGWGEKLEEATTFYGEKLETYQEEDYLLDAHSDKVKDTMWRGNLPYSTDFAVDHDMENF